MNTADFEKKVLDGGITDFGPLISPNNVVSPSVQDIESMLQ